MNKKITALMLVSVLLAGLSGCDTGCTSATIDLTGDLVLGLDEEKVISCTSEDPQAVKMHSLSEQFFADTWETCGENGNFLMSPLSLIEVLGMVSEGSGGQTRRQLEDLFGVSTNVLSQHMRYLENNLPSAENDAKLEIANSIWIRDTDRLEVEEEFLQNVKGYYDAAVFKAAFDESTVGDINRWCADNTDDMIDEILETIDSQQMLFLINAICFDAKWKEPYEKKDVYEGKFYLEDGGTSAASYMRSEEFGYLTDENTTGFVRPYKEGYSFVALLPEKGLTMAEYLEGFDGSKLENLLLEKKEEVVYCTLPKFSGETFMDLMGMLEGCGVTDLFDPSRADLSKMAQIDGENLYVSQVIQKTFIEVDEQGTRAAAISLAAAGEGAMEPMNVVDLNRPFVYAIVEDASGLPVFMGVVMNPAE